MSTLIFGILSIGFGLLKLSGPLMLIAMSHMKLPANSGMEALKSDPAYAALMNFNAWAGVVLGLALLTFGIGLLLLKNWARMGLIVYAMIDIILVLFVSVLTWPFTKRMMEQVSGPAAAFMERFGIVFVVFGILFSLAFPVLLLIFMTRPNVIEACQPEQPAAPVASPEPL